jgi:anion-transporting  ArsA/GET3 family ATPase
VPPLLDRRLVVVGGKGGVGRSTVVAALALAAVRGGRSTLIAEVVGQADVARVLGAAAGAPLAETRLTHGLHHVTIERRAALREYLREEVPGPVPATIFARSRMFDLFIEAAPGMNELLTIGKIWELVQRPRRRRRARAYDLVIVDAPATGQLVGLLEAPQTYASIARTGPVAHQAEQIRATLRDPRLTAFVAVVTPEQMPVSETAGLHGSMGRVLGRGLDGLVVNRLLPERFTAAESRVVRAAGDDPPLRSARWFDGRLRAQQDQLIRLRAALPDVSMLAELPFLFTDRICRADIQSLADRLGRDR